VWHEASEARLCMRVLLPGCDRLMHVVQQARRLFDLGADALHIGSFLARNPRLADKVKQRPGLRVPGSWDGFELAVLAVLGQNLADAGSAPAIESLIKTFGRPMHLPLAGLTHLFPQPKMLVEADLEGVGIPAQQAHTISALAKAVLTGDLAFDSAKGGRCTLSHLRAFPGVGEETAAYIGMRALGDPDAFSSGSLPLRRAMASHRGIASPKEVTRIFEAYRPWRAYAAMHYWASMREPNRAPHPSSAARKNNARPIRPRSRAFRRTRVRP